MSLRDPGKPEYLGEIILTATLWPRSQEDKDQVGSTVCVSPFSLHGTAAFPAAFFSGLLQKIFKFYALPFSFLLMDL